MDTAADSDPDDDDDAMVEGVTEELHFDLADDGKGEQQQALHLLSQESAARMDIGDPQRTHVCPVSVWVLLLKVNSSLSLIHHQIAFMWGHWVYRKCILSQWKLIL